MLIPLLPCSRIGLAVDVQRLAILFAHKAEDSPEALVTDGFITYKSVRILADLTPNAIHLTRFNIVDIAKCQTCCLGNVGNSAPAALKEHSNAEGGHHVFLNLLLGLLLAHSVDKMVV